MLDLSKINFLDIYEEGIPWLVSLLDKAKINHTLKPTQEEAHYSQKDAQLIYGLLANNHALFSSLPVYCIEHRLPIGKAGYCYQCFDRTKKEGNK